MRADLMKYSLLLLSAATLLGAPAASQPAAAAPREATSVESDDGVSVHTGDRVVRRDEVVEGDLVVTAGDLRVRGEIRGNAIVTAGNLILEEDGRIRGDAVVTGGRLIDEGGRVFGEMRVMDGASAPAPSAPVAAARHVRSERSERSWMDPIAQGLRDLLSTLALGLVLAAIGAGLVFYGLPYLRTVSDTVRNSTLRSGAVGVAATFLVVPAFVILIVGLAVTVVGIPLILLAAPLYPLLVIAAFGLGLAGAAHAIGERTVDQRHELRHRNAYTYVFTGVGLLLAPLAIAALVEMVSFLHWVGVLLKIAAVAAIWAVSTVGLGAVILSRAGRDRSFADPDFDPAFERDPLFDSEPVVR